jgi:hypothetical protein
MNSASKMEEHDVISCIYKKQINSILISAGFFRCVRRYMCTDVLEELAASNYNSAQVDGRLEPPSSLLFL